MTIRESLDTVIRNMPDEKLRVVLDFAQFVSWNQERHAWAAFGKTQLARAYGPDEPEYTDADLKPELN